MSVSKLRNKEESAFAAKKVQKKVEEKKPLTMAEALKERLARRNGALSGKNEKEDKKRDSLIVAAARQQPPPPSGASKASANTASLLTLGFAPVNADKGASSDDEDFKFNKPGYNKAQESDTESDTVSEFSEDSRAYSAPAPPKPKPVTAASAPQPPNRNGSLAAPIPPPFSAPAPASAEVSYLVIFHHHVNIGEKVCLPRWYAVVVHCSE